MRRLRIELNRLEMEVYNSRAERYPEDLSYRYELALRLKRAGNFAEALKVYAEAIEHPDHRLAATIESGECLQQLKKYQMAYELYEQAIRDSLSGEAELHKLALYRAGVLGTGLKHYDQARNHLTRLIELDPGFKDAASRLDKVKQISNDG